VEASSRAPETKTKQVEADRKQLELGG
jgi:hypothetical protein